MLITFFFFFEKKKERNVKSKMNKNMKLDRITID